MVDPTGAVRLPAHLASASPTLVWSWPHKQSVWRLDTDGDVHFAKVAMAGRFPSLADEAARLRWLTDSGAPLATPVVTESGAHDDIEWLVTAEVPGVDATLHPLKTSDPARLVSTLAAGLRRWHDSLDQVTCPFRFTVDDALDHVAQRHAAGLIQPDDLHAEFVDLEVDGAVVALYEWAPTNEDLVVCHGDYCFPNVLLDDAGEVVAFVDLGELAVADRWWDVAIGAWSTTWNVGPGYEDVFYEAYGIDPDPDRIRFFRLLYDLVS